MVLEILTSGRREIRVKSVRGVVGWRDTVPRIASLEHNGRVFGGTVPSTLLDANKKSGTPSQRGHRLHAVLDARGT
jgi:hypothetical protein